MQLRGNLKEEERKHQTMLVPDVQRDNYSINVFIKGQQDGSVGKVTVVQSLVT